MSPQTPHSVLVPKNQLALKDGRRSRVAIVLPLGGVACTDPCEVREPLIRPFWLLVAGLGVAVLIFVWLRVNLF